MTMQTLHPRVQVVWVLRAVLIAAVLTVPFAGGVYLNRLPEWAPVVAGAVFLVLRRARAPPIPSLELRDPRGRAVPRPRRDHAGPDDGTTGPDSARRLPSRSRRARRRARLLRGVHGWLPRRRRPNPGTHARRGERPPRRAEATGHPRGRGGRGVKLAPQSVPYRALQKVSGIVVLLFFIVNNNPDWGLRSRPPSSALSSSPRSRTRSRTTGGSTTS